jgi:hypothetical protein
LGWRIHLEELQRHWKIVGKPLTVITLAPSFTDNIYQIKTMSDCFWLVIYLNGTYHIWSQ